MDGEFPSVFIRVHLCSPGANQVLGQFPLGLDWGFEAMSIRTP